MNSIYSVGQVNTYIKNMFNQDFMLNKIYIKGEVSNCKYHTSGHIYFSLKDETGTLSCVMFAGCLLYTSLFTDIALCKEILNVLKRMLATNGTLVFAVDTVRCV